MKILCVFLASGALVLGGAMTGNGAYIHDKWDPSSTDDEQNIYEIWNALFDDHLRSSNQLEQVRDGEDYIWYANQCTVLFTVRNAGYAQELGVHYGGAYHKLVDHIPDRLFVPRRLRITPQDQAGNALPFSWVEKTSGSPDWYSDNRRNKRGNKDHFLAVEVKDTAFTERFYATWGSPEAFQDGHLWFLCFEDLNLGDRDYNDLVLVAQTSSTPVPLSSTLLYLASALLALLVRGHILNIKNCLSPGLPGKSPP
jgi:hypothetical protein